MANHWHMNLIYDSNYNHLVWLIVVTITNEGKETIMAQCEEDRKMTHAILSTFVTYYVGTLHCLHLFLKLVVV
jgi:hypothetical protein